MFLVVMVALRCFVSLDRSARLDVPTLQRSMRVSSVFGEFMSDGASDEPLFLRPTCCSSLLCSISSVGVESGWWESWNET